MTTRTNDFRFFLLGALSCQALISFSAHLSAMSQAAGHVSHAPFLASAIFAVLVIGRVAAIHGGERRHAVMAQIGAAILIADAIGVWLFGSYVVGQAASRSVWWIALVGNITLATAVLALIARVNWREAYRRIFGLWRILIALAVGRTVAGLIGYAFAVAPEAAPLTPAAQSFASFFIGASLMTPFAFATGAFWHFKVAGQGKPGQRKLVIALGVLAILSAGYGVALLQLD